MKEEIFKELERIDKEIKCELLLMTSPPTGDGGWNCERKDDKWIFVDYLDTMGDSGKGVEDNGRERRKS